jgi:hypothetical protein
VRSGPCSRGDENGLDLTLFWSQHYEFFVTSPLYFVTTAKSAQPGCFFALGHSKSAHGVGAPDRKDHLHGVRRSPLPERKGALCAPADPSFDGKAFNDLMQATQT